MHGAAEQEAVAPVDRVLAGLDVPLHAEHFPVREAEGVEPLARRALGYRLLYGDSTPGAGRPLTSVLAVAAKVLSRLPYALSYHSAARTRAP